MEQLIVSGIMKIDKMEKEHGRLGTLVGILLILVISATALFILAGVSIAWLKALDWTLRTFFGFGL